MEERVQKENDQVLFTLFACVSFCSLNDAMVDEECLGYGADVNLWPVTVELCLTAVHQLLVLTGWLKRSSKAETQPLMID